MTSVVVHSHPGHHGDVWDADWQHILILFLAHEKDEGTKTLSYNGYTDIRVATDFNFPNEVVTFENN